ncbi:Receptor-type tyrosine-protein phosphatase kappa [Liparis tanakae]|uniref:Receptor-type tyrosine-protein phosphatase kappa n=1 Tax=Liparis tanakae TaxID=230148 RepID=A0A4Z2FX63_9TELE|nr:Receptor-type tyrosine-protein phosphatase kappa [Liparis tanakae]
MFDEGFTQCDYQQDPYDDFDWTHINTQEVPYVSPDLPQGGAGGVAGQVNGSELPAAHGGAERYLRVREQGLTFDVLITPAGRGTSVQGLENEVPAGD